MALSLTISNGGGRGLYVTSSTTRDPLRRQLIFFPIPTSICTAGNSNRTRLVVSAAKKLSSRTGRFDSKNRRSGGATTAEEEQEQRSYEIPEGESVVKIESGSVEDGFVLPDLPGGKPDFWEGPQWDAFGFFMQYMWAFGIVFALIACGIAVVTYNEGATDFKETPAYKESIQSRELLEGPEASGSDSDVFESNPTEVAPSLE